MAQAVPATAPAATPIAAPAPPSTPAIQAMDADSQRVIVNTPGRVTAVFLCTEESQKEIRDAAGKLDKFRGLSNFRVIAVVDLRDSLGNMVEGIVRWRMQEDLDEESERLAPFYRANGNNKEPRPDLCAIPDFNGAVCKSLGWPKVSNKLRCVVFGPDGQPLQRWDELKNYTELYDVVAKALGKN
ncbi:MAG: hypothetical protein B9S32_08575 [Verrucomicrobia bacterium Tous-C9LFEB]|nr:MAG: hypothetical protein B9S32_08575 [Verrucomicrobia bacterium Tous-C9LFEB]